MTLLQLEHAATLADPLLSDTLYRLIRTCREHDAEKDLAGRVEGLRAATTDPAQHCRYADMLNESTLRRKRCEADILNLVVRLTFSTSRGCWWRKRRYGNELSRTAVHG